MSPGLVTVAAEGPDGTGVKAEGLVPRVRAISEIFKGYRR